MKYRYIPFILLLATLTAYAEEETQTQEELRIIDARIAAEQAKGAKADQNLLAWLQAKRQELIPPDLSAEHKFAEQQQKEQLEQERWQQQLEADAKFTEQLAKDNAAREAARSEDYAARQQQEIEAQRYQYYPDYVNYGYGYPYYWGYAPGIGYIPDHNRHHDHPDHHGDRGWDHGHQGGRQSPQEFKNYLLDTLQNPNPQLGTLKGHK